MASHDEMVWRPPLAPALNESITEQVVANERLANDIGAASAIVEVLADIFVLTENKMGLCFDVLVRAAIELGEQRRLEAGR